MTDLIHTCLILQYVYFNPLHVSSILIIRRLNCIDAASGIVTLSKWLSGVQVERELRSNNFEKRVFSVVTSVRPSIHPSTLNNSAPPRWSVMKFHI